MKIIILCLLTLGSSFAFADDGWVSLFNGKSLKGWQVHGGEATYEIQNGAIIGKNGPKHNTFLTTSQSFANFELEFDVYLKNPMNSGVQVRSSFKDMIHPKSGKKITRVFGPQVEIERSPGESGYIYGEQLGQGWLTPKDQLKTHDYFKNDAWNKYRIVADGPRIQTWVYGNKVSDLTDKKNYANNATGFIGLQVHSIKAEPNTLEVQWKNIRIKELPETKNEWVSIFNGEDLAGWIPKVGGYELGANPGDVFTVKDGVLHISHKNFPSFDGRFGHLFYKEPVSNYKLRLEYRFLDGRVEGGPKFAYRNSGVMIHGQDPATIDKHYGFPRSIEVQMLGRDPEAMVNKETTDKRTTANICTPGTQFVSKGKLVKRHCINSSVQAIAGDAWVSLEIHALGSKEVAHFINGEEAMRYQNPQLDDGTLLDGGSISLQAESHDLEIRNIEIMKL